MTRPCGLEWTRRRALRVAGTALAAAAVSRYAPPLRAQPAGRIDVHHHWHPPAIAAAFEGVNIGASWPGGEWSVSGALSLMDRFDIRAGLLSVRNPRARVSAAACREVNEAAAGILADHGSRFGALAMLPQYDFDAAAAEAAYALDTLGLDGVALNPSVDNHYLGAAQYEPLMAELGRRRAVVLLHPTTPHYFGELGLDIRSSVIEYVFETTRAIANLILSGTIERHPQIRWITAHAGGAAPYIAARLAEQGERFDPEVRERAPRGVLSYMKTLYYGTAQATSVYTLRALLELVDPSRIVFGTDLPISPPALIEESDAVLSAYPGLTAENRRAIEVDNALALFPRLG